MTAKPKKPAPKRGTKREPLCDKQCAYIYERGDGRWRFLDREDSTNWDRIDAVIISLSHYRRLCRIAGEKP